MAKELDERQEAFARALASGKSQADAFRASGYRAKQAKDLYTRASKLANNPEIMRRVAELKAPAVRRAEITLESHLADLKRLRDAAEEAGQFAPAIKAEENRGKVAGLYVEKHEHSGPNGGAIPTTLTLTVIDPKGGK